MYTMFIYSGLLYGEWGSDVYFFTMRALQKIIEKH